MFINNYEKKEGERVAMLPNPYMPYPLMYGDDTHWNPFPQSFIDGGIKNADF